MLRVTSTLQLGVPCLVEVDPYLPLSFKTYPGVAPRALYYRIGNFHTSLLEIGIEPSSMVIRKVSLISFDKTINAVNYIHLIWFRRFQDYLWSVLDRFPGTGPTCRMNS